MTPSIGNKSERGATALLVAMAMLVMMGLAAFAVDIGLAMNERRQDQSAADVGALAALQFAQPDPGCSGASCFAQAVAKGANAAIDVANATLDDPSLADWSNTALCGTPPTGFTVTSVSSCVAFTNNFGRAWVKIPTIASPTYFAKLFGGDQVNVSAYAVADQKFGNAGQVLPFLLPGNAGGTDYNCLKSGPNPTWGVCADLPSSGNFGSMDFLLYGNPDRNTTQKCSGDTNGRLVSNIARGIDHPLGLHPTGSGAGTKEPTNCPNLGAEPDMALGQPGVGSAIEPGLVYGGTSYSLDGSSYDGRIEDGSGFKVRNASGSTPAVKVDNVALWDYLKGSLPMQCNGVDIPSEMLACISWAKTNHVEIFKGNIIDSPRFGFTPEVAEPTFLTPGQYYHIVGYRPVFIDTTYYGCTATRCDIVHTPDMPNISACPPAAAFITCGTPGAKSKGLVAVTAYILSPDLLPDVAKSPAPGQAGQRQYNLSE